MSNENKEFYDLLNSIADEQTFALELSDGTEVSCRQLSTAQLKELIRTVVDSPLTQAAFNSAVTKVFKDSLIETPAIALNIIDRLLFILETRIQSLSPSMVADNDGKRVNIDFKQIRHKLQEQIKNNKDLFEVKTISEGKLSLNVGVALLSTESKLNDEIYKDFVIDTENAEQLRKLLGEAFINEIAKALQSVSIGEKTLDLSKVTFKSRLKTVESLPASTIQKVIEYIENYKKIVDECFIVDGYTVPVDGSLFSLR